MAFIYFHLEFAGDSNLDQPVYIKAVVRDHKNSPMDNFPDFERKVRISRTQIWNPITAAMYKDLYRHNAQPISLNANELPEKDVARLLYEFLTRIYEKFDKAPVYWVADFLYGSHTHQLRAFLIRHGFSPYFNYNKNTFFIDSNYFPDLGAGQPFGNAYKVVSNELDGNLPMFSRFGFPHSVMDTHWIKFQVKKRIPFAGEMAPTPVSSVSTKKGKLYKSVFIPVSSNERGALFVDAGAWYLSLEKNPKSISECLFWVNYSGFVVRKASQDDKGAQDLKKAALARLKDDKEAYSFLKDGISSDYYFQMVGEKNKGVDPEIAIYGHNIDLKNLSSLFRAIYQNDTEALEAVEDKVLTLFYLRHIIRSHTWSKNDYLPSNEEEDVEIKDFLRQYVLYRYKTLGSKREFSTGKKVTTIDEMIEWTNGDVDSEIITQFSEFLLSSEAYKALE